MDGEHGGEAGLFAARRISKIVRVITNDVSV
jgi:hypothetical protein